MLHLLLVSLLATTNPPPSDSKQTPRAVDASASHAPVGALAQKADATDASDDDDETVAPLPAAAPGESEPLPTDGAIAAEPVPVVEGPRLKNDAPNPAGHDEWLTPYREDGTLVEAEGQWPMWAVVGSQIAAGTGIGLLFAPPALALIAASTVFLPDTLYEGLGQTGLVVASTLGAVGVVSVAAPGAIAVSQTLIGDWLSPRRGALVWPLLSAYIAAGASWMTTAITVSATVGAIKQAGQRGDPIEPISTMTVAFLAPAVAGLLLTVAAPVATYAVFSEQKRVGDDGRGFPGLLAPHHASAEQPLALPRVVEASPAVSSAPIRF